MGRNRRSRTHSSAKNQAKDFKTKRYRRDLDQIEADLRDPFRRERMEGPWLADKEDLPGTWLYLCVCVYIYVWYDLLMYHTDVYRRRRICLY